MGAPKGNQFWKQRSKHGRDKIFETPKYLWEAAQEYFQWCDNNPWLKHDTVKAGDHFGKNVSAPVTRPYTINGLCIFLDINPETFLVYGRKEEYKDFFGVVNKIKEIIYTQKYEGAAVGAFNWNVISRDLGLADKTHHEHHGEVTIKVEYEDDKDKDKASS